jgi:galactose mutarotase-like enzyme
MQRVNHLQEGPYKGYELIHPESDSFLKVVPERGGIITELRLQGHELLYLNKETLHNPQTNARGGIPILFPISGALENGEYQMKGSVYRMGNHGVARNLPWKTVGIQDDEKALSITIEATSNKDTRSMFPFDFQLIFKYTLGEQDLMIHQEYMNHSQEDMPIYAGFHPYFKTAQKTFPFEIDAKEYVDYNDMICKPFSGKANLQDKKESLVFKDSGQGQVTFGLSDPGVNVLMEYGKEFKYIVLWTEKDKEFICVEPWMAKNNELNRREELTYIPAGKSLKTWMRISLK